MDEESKLSGLIVTLRHSENVSLPLQRLAEHSDWDIVVMAAHSPSEYMGMVTRTHSTVHLTMTLMSLLQELLTLSASYLE
jgi:hypothetical protein